MRGHSSVAAGPPSERVPGAGLTDVLGLTSERAVLDDQLSRLSEAEAAGRHQGQALTSPDAASRPPGVRHRPAATSTAAIKPVVWTVGSGDGSSAARRYQGRDESVRWEPDWLVQR
jgi:hypothetical protein